jgi:hypothetical protein
LTAKSIAKLDCRSGMPTLTMLAPTGVQLLVAIWRVTGGYAEPKGAEAISPTGGHLPGDVPRNCLAGALCRTFDGGAARECVLNGGLTGAGPVVDGSSACPLTWAGMPARPHGWSVHRFTVADDLRCLADHPCSLADAIRSFRIFVYSPHAKPNFARTDESPCSGHRVGSAALREKPFSVDLPAGEQALSPSGGRTRYNRRACSLGGGAYPGMAAGQISDAAPEYTTATCRACGAFLLAIWQFGHLVQQLGAAGSNSDRNHEDAGTLVCRPAAAWRALCRRWWRKWVSRMGPVTKPWSLGGEPSRLEVGEA